MKFTRYIKESALIEAASGPFVLVKKEIAGNRLSRIHAYGEFDSMEEASQWMTENVDMRAEQPTDRVKLSVDSLINIQTEAKQQGIVLNVTWNPRQARQTADRESIIDGFNPFFYNKSKSRLHHQWLEYEKTLQEMKEEIDQINEAVRRSRGENSASMVERATSICLESWYNLTKVFNSSPDKYDPHPVEPSDDYMHFKLAPGIDARDDAFERITDEAENIADKLNDALGRRLFEPEILRKDGMLEVRTVYVEGSGGIFKADTREGEVGVIIEMVMPRQKILRDAFSKLITTPSMPIVDEPPQAQPVMPDQPDFGEEDLNAQL